MQIPVVVANIQMRTLKTEVEKGSMSTVFVHGLVGPKVVGLTAYVIGAFFISFTIINEDVISIQPKGNRVNIPEPGYKLL